MGIEKRRSDRVMLTIPLLVYGQDASGMTVKMEALTVVVNRHGARIRIGNQLLTAQSLHIANRITGVGAEFRVVGPVAPFSEKGGEYGVECVGSTEGIWGIRFPPIADPGASFSKALLECRKCHTVALIRVSLVEVDVLSTSGIVLRACETCNRSTPWGYPQKQVAMNSPPGESEMFREAELATSESDRRRHPRVTLQLPTLVRDYYGGIELTQTENASKSGCCFASAKTYYFGQGIFVTCPYSGGAQDIETPARIVRAPKISGSDRVLYGVRYEKTSDYREK